MESLSGSMRSPWIGTFGTDPPSASLGWNFVDGRTGAFRLGTPYGRRPRSGQRLGWKFGDRPYGAVVA
jgi:hypothetical protein